MSFSIRAGTRALRLLRRGGGYGRQRSRHDTSPIRPRHPGAPHVRQSPEPRPGAEALSL